MILGLSTHAFTVVHVIISLIGIASGLIVVFGMLGSRRLGNWTALFLLTTILTSVTGFFFPIHGVTPALTVGVISLVILAVALLARYVKHLVGAWRWIWVVTAVAALWFNTFVLVVQSFLKLPALHALAPNGNEPPFLIAQAAVLIVLVVLGVIAVLKFRPAPAAH
ncbi:MAG TPA: hypothetical protein VHV56_12825 [Pseudolabrys sp.]|jgi:hypothetical protein|nr:hypothetical protein [Pseudolabrys sp.]